MQDLELLDRIKNPDMNNQIKVIRQNYRMIKLVPEKVRTQENIETLFKYEPRIIEFMSDYLPYIKITDDMVKALVDKNPEYFRHLPDELVTEELLINIIKKNHELISNVKTTHITKPVLMEAIGKDIKYIIYTPENLMKEDIMVVDDELSLSGPTFETESFRYMYKPLLNGRRLENNVMIVIEHKVTGIIRFKFGDFQPQTRPIVIARLNFALDNNIINNEFSKKKHLKALDMLNGV